MFYRRLYVKNAHISYMVKALKNLLLWNQKADDLESWCSIRYSSTMKFIQMMTLDDHYLFYSKVKFGPLRFCRGKDIFCGL